MSSVIKKVNSLTTALYTLLALFARLLTLVDIERYSLRALGDCLEEVVDVVFHEEFRGNQLQLEGVVVRLVVATVTNALFVYFVDNEGQEGFVGVVVFAVLAAPLFFAAFVDSVILVVLEEGLKTFFNFGLEVKSLEKSLRVWGLSGTTHPCSHVHFWFGL